MSAEGIFGSFEHLRETRFTVPQITFIVTPGCVSALENRAVLPTACSKNARIRASWAKFQKSPSWRSRAASRPSSHAQLETRRPPVAPPIAQRERRRESNSERGRRGCRERPRQLTGSRRTLREATTSYHKSWLDSTIKSATPRRREAGGSRLETGDCGLQAGGRRPEARTCSLQPPA